MLSEYAHQKHPEEEGRSSHFDIAVDDLGSNPMMSVSIGTKIPPPPTPPTLPNAAPKNPISVPSTICQPNCIGCRKQPTRFTKSKPHVLKTGMKKELLKSTTGITAVQ